MQLIATRGFKNNAKPFIEFAPEHNPIDKNGDAVDGLHPDGVHKGARFSIGGDRKLEEMKNQQQHVGVIRQLLSAGVIGDANDADLCKKIDKEVALENRQRDETTRLRAGGNVVPPTAAPKAAPKTAADK